MENLQVPDDRGNESSQGNCTQSKDDTCPLHPALLMQNDTLKLLFHAGQVIAIQAIAPWLNGPYAHAHGGEVADQDSDDQEFGQAIAHQVFGGEVATKGSYGKQ